tara:strand:- start:3977 stop:4195 length:219 start_codon:yes stop_codon:yes gene_type:complete
MSSSRFLDFSKVDMTADAKLHPEPEAENFTVPQNNQGRKVKDVDDLEKGLGTGETSDFKSVENYIPPRGVPR